MEIESSGKGKLLQPNMTMTDSLFNQPLSRNVNKNATSGLPALNSVMNSTGGSFYAGQRSNQKPSGKFFATK